MLAMKEDLLQVSGMNSLHLTVFKSFLEVQIVLRCDIVALDDDV